KICHGLPVAEISYFSSSTNSIFLTYRSRSITRSKELAQFMFLSGVMALHSPGISIRAAEAEISIATPYLPLKINIGVCKDLINPEKNVRICGRAVTGRKI
ncbi:MAG TPA: hypothetical protein PLN48_12420, partial [Lachnospiraceae bacterium]|nr:hypothetical protein [Lachnospiraceae bacterium]